VEARDADGRLAAASSQGVVLAPPQPSSSSASSGAEAAEVVGAAEVSGAAGVAGVVAGAAVTLRMGGDGSEVRLWSPESPHLYSLRVVLRRQASQGGGEGGGGGEIVDEVSSYVGMRTVGTARDAAGHLRITLNGAPRFQLGPLDQGWWPDGLLSPPSDTAMRYDIEFAKACLPLPLPLPLALALALPLALALTLALALALALTLTLTLRRAALT
jgi:hypothetical protein